MAFQRKTKVAPKKTDNIVKKPSRAQHLIEQGHVFKPGNNANPHGRPKGSRNKLGEAFLAELLTDFEEYGAFAIADCRKEDPSRYCAIIASILPKEISLDDEERLLEKFLEQFTGEQLDQFIAGIVALGDAETGEGSQVKKLPRSQPNCVQ